MALHRQRGLDLLLGDQSRRAAPARRGDRHRPALHRGTRNRGGRRRDAAGCVDRRRPPHRLLPHRRADGGANLRAHRQADRHGDPARHRHGGGFSGDADDPETFFTFSSFNAPATVYRYDARSNQTSVWAQPQVAFKPEDFTVEQRFYRSKDGTRIPLFLVYRKGLDLKRKHPTLLYGYGGFNISLTPTFSSTNLAWVEQGGVYAVANLRGGGEYGKAWHDAGRLANKQNVFDDFIGAAEYLIREDITSKDQLAIYGRSNGGLLVGAAVNQRPDLFAAALPAVGVMDMLRFNRWTAGRYWVDDYGYPDRDADFRTLRAYSPYHNIRSGADYPAVLVTTADTDDRVVPGHSFKYAAALQAANTGPAPKLIRIETRAGHGSGKPTEKIIEEYADMWAFIAAHTGMQVGSNRSAD
jgi:prolyl oligopeptidase